MRKRLIVINGVHGSGKSTLAQRLAAEHDNLTYYPEVGDVIRNGVWQDTTVSKEEFDLRVMHTELARDSDLITCPRVPVVETWHIGNLAYAMARGATVVNNYRNLLELQLALFSPLGILLDVTWEIFAQRVGSKMSLKRCGEFVTFYERVVTHTVSLYDQLNVPLLKISNDGPPEESLTKLSAILEQHRYLD